MNPTPVSIEANPFALLLAPEAVIARIAASPRLAMLNSRVCRPLDKPMLGGETTAATDAEDDRLEMLDAGSETAELSAD